MTLVAGWVLIMFLSYENVNCFVIEIKKETFHSNHFVNIMGTLF